MILAIVNTHRYSASLLRGIKEQFNYNMVVKGIKPVDPEFQGEKRGGCVDASSSLFTVFI
jgi:hypothetical protein